MQQLRHAGYSAEANLVQRSLKAQFKSVDRNNARYVVILGEDEVKNNTMNVKNISDKSQVTIKQDELLETLKQWENK